MFGSQQWMYSSGEPAYELESSVRFNDDDAQYLSWTPSTAGNRKTFTMSFWVKPCHLTKEHYMFNAGTSNSGWTEAMRFNSSQFQWTMVQSGASAFILKPLMKFRDPTAWYHIVCAMDTTQATPSNRAKIYINGARVTEWSTEEYPSLNYEAYFYNNSNIHALGIQTYNYNSGQYYDGYMAEVHFVDGQQLSPDYFGEIDETYGHWKPKEVDISTTPKESYGTNGFYLPLKQDYAVEGFSTTLYDGDSTKPKYIGGAGFSPDLVWLKCRNQTYEQLWFDRIRGAGQRVYSHTTTAETTNTNTLSDFNNDGFTVGTSSAYDLSVNGSGNDYVAWSWDMGADTPTGFNAIKYTGNGNGTFDIGGVGFQPDLVWIKNRETSGWNIMVDAVREAPNVLQINTNAESSTGFGYGKVNKFTPEGFQVDSGSNVNTSGDDYIAWCWDMGGETVTNTNGSRTSSVRASTDYGQSIVTWTGNQSNGTVGHGLSSAPELIIVRRRDSSQNWIVGSDELTSWSYGIKFNDTAAQFSDSTFFNSTAPTNQVFSVGTSGTTNGTDMVAYCFHSVSGYSKIGTYTGNGSTSGPTVTTGFRPAFLMVKEKISGGGWLMVDNVRDNFNPTTQRLLANSPNVEDTSADNNIEFTDTGFVVKTSSGSWNQSGTEIMYIAFAGGADSISEFNTDGSIDSRVKANPTYGQSIVSYEGNGTDGATVGHGLSSAPEMIIAKRRDSSGSWPVYHKAIGGGGYLYFDRTEAKTTQDYAWNGTDPTSSVFELDGGSTSTNTSGSNMIAYCFHSVSGYSKIDSYTGTGSDGNSITTGFEPALVVIKCSSSTADWNVFDNQRKTNSGHYRLEANTTDTEVETTDISFTSTGFTVDGSTSNRNSSGQTYIYMAFADKREYAYWLDSSGNNNDWTSNNLTDSDVSLDTPTNNFATWNTLNVNNVTLSEGNTKVSVSSGTSSQIGATMGVKTGKWYFEYLGISSQSSLIGFTSDNFNADSSGNSYDYGDSVLYYASSSTAPAAYVYVDGSRTGYGKTWQSENAVIGVALNLDDGNITFYKNGEPQGTVTSKTFTSGSYYIPTLGNGSSSYSATGVVNFGQDSSFAGLRAAQGNTDSGGIGDFYYEPPSGYKALCTKNLPEPGAVPSENFNAITYTGNDTDNTAITGVGFAPDFVWSRRRSTVTNHGLFDVLRGANKRLSTNLDDAEFSDDNALESFDSDGFTASSDGTINAAGTYVAWNWKANGSGVSNTDGDITSTVSANQDAGFSIVSYTGSGTDGDTVGHGLSSAPEVVIVKARNNANYWVMGHHELSSTPYVSGDFMYLNNDYSKQNASNVWSGTAPTSSVFTIGTSGNINVNDRTYIAYCFHSVDGFSKFGSYTGNGSDDGTFVYTGFRPAFVMMKRTDGSGNSWGMFDSARDIDNPNQHYVYADGTGTENTGSDRVDFLSNGFKWRNTATAWNGSGNSYIYMAFAEYPFKYSNARGTSLDKYVAPAQNYKIDQSVRLEETSDSKLYRTYGSGGNRKTWTFSTWVKRSKDDDGQIFSCSTSANELYFIYFQTDDTLRLREYYGGGYYYMDLITDREFRDYSNWYHIVVAMDTTQSTASNRVKVYVNGEQITSFSTTTYPSLNRDMAWNSNRIHYLGSNTIHVGPPSLYYAETHFVDGQALGPEHFGTTDETYGNWIPTAYGDGTPEDDYGATGWYLDFSNASDLGEDQSGKGNDWSVNNLASGDQVLDSPTNNFATINPAVTSSYITLKEGALETYGNSSGDNGNYRSSFLPSSGKWYVEVRCGTTSATNNPRYGIVKASHAGLPSNGYSTSVGGSGDSVSYQRTGDTLVDGSASTTLNSFTTGDIIGMALDCDNGAIYYAKNNTWENSGSPTSGSSRTGSMKNFTPGDLYAFGGSDYNGSTSNWNFGADSSFAGNETAQGNTDGNGKGDFYYTPPTGYLAMCSDNMPAPGVVPRENFQTVIWSGDGVTAANGGKRITGVDFEPDMTWIKTRNDSYNHYLVDRMRGTDSDGYWNLIQPNLTTAEISISGPGDAFVDFNIDGFTVAQGSGSWYGTNQSGKTYVGWNWKADNTTGSSNTNGSITSTVSANQAAGFSIVTYTGNATTGATIGHGLSKAPEMIIFFNRDAGGIWTIYHDEVGATKDIRLNELQAAATSAVFNNTAPDSTKFTVSNGARVNGSGQDIIAYCWHSVEGYSKISSFIGNGSTNGPFVYTGFRPQMIFMKNMDTTRANPIMDSIRGISNGDTKASFTHANQTEQTHLVDYLSNGFKLRTSDANFNESDNEFMYIAFGEYPFNHTNAK